MSIRKIPTCEEAKQQIKLVDYLAALGYHPIQVRGKDFWYLSPLHEEKTASFKVNNEINAWKDWGTGDKGTLIDFGVKYHQCSVADFLQKLSGFNFIPIDNPMAERTPSARQEEEKKIEIVRVHELSSFALLHYLEGRKIPDVVATQFCKEVSYKMNGKNYYAIGFKNDEGGYELRNRYIKGASSPKAPTFIDNNAQELITFEGFFNFLSYQSIHHPTKCAQSNYLILNSTSFFQQQLPRMQSHQKVLLYLDNDNTGDKCTRLALNMDANKFSDQRHLYKGFNDLNDWQMKMVQQHRNRITHKP